ncbi:MAG: hypothetical protein WCQ75_00770 [Bacilli bacterium]
MKNAFMILGATPQDDRNKLQELFEDKQLLSDDGELINITYSELTNLKKRITHEIKYFSKDVFENFDNNFLENDEEEQEMNMEDICSSIISVGKWFDKGTDELFTTINENRKIAGFSVIGNEDIIENAVLKLKEDCTSAVKKYFDFWEQKDIISLFNMLVEQNDYMSFFIDDLLVHYENLLQEAFENKKKLCQDKFQLIENNSNTYINSGSIDETFQNNITAFKKAINAWDKLAQPLQVNFANRGAQHPGSLDFLHDLRNKVINMCNKSQEDLQKLIEKLQYDYSARQDLILKLSNSEEYIINLIKILDVLLLTFKEIDVIAEKLKNDKKDFLQLKETLTVLCNKVVPLGYSRPATSSIPTRPTSNGSSDYNWKKVVGWVIGIFIAIMIIVGIVNSSNSANDDYTNGGYSSTYTLTLDKQGGINGTSSVVVTYGSSMPYATAPTKSGYSFQGYYYYRNGSGSQYYNSSMGSMRNWGNNDVGPLYAYWEEIDTGITLTTNTFEDYFSFSSSCSVTSSSSYYRTIKYSYSITPKSSFDYSNSNNPSSISVVIGLDVSSYQSSYGTPSEYKIYVTLYKSNGYRTSSNQTYTVNSNEEYWNDGIYSVSGKIYD